MPWNLSRAVSFREREILKYWSGLEVIKSVVLDANDLGSWPLPADRNARNVVPAGTILKVSVTNPKQYVKYAGAGTIEGILLHSVEIAANQTAGVEAVPLIYFNAVFATEAIVDFTTHAAALVTALNSCKFE
jgi:hypothetical protein